MRISDWSSDVCSSDLRNAGPAIRLNQGAAAARRTASFSKSEPTRPQMWTTTPAPFTWKHAQSPIMFRSDAARGLSAAFGYSPSGHGIREQAPHTRPGSAALTASSGSPDRSEEQTYELQSLMRI